MKKILVPVDFSSCSQDAFSFAKGLASSLGFDIRVVHIFSGTLNINQPDIFRPGKTKELALQEQLDNFIQIPDDANNHSPVVIQSKIETQLEFALNITKKLIELSQDPEVALVVMGTKGAGMALEKLLGSTASTMAQHAACPVFLIPKDTQYHGFKEILYASNYESIDEEFVQQIIDLGNLFRATMHFVHVDEGDNYETIEDSIFNKLFKEGDPSFSFNIVNIKHDSVIEGLNQYAEENGVDLITLVNRQRNFVDNILQNSLTQRLARTTQRPLLVFHTLI